MDWKATSNRVWLWLVAALAGGGWRGQHAWLAGRTRNGGGEEGRENSSYYLVNDEVNGLGQQWHR